MLHVGLDMHKRFSEVAVLDDAGAVVDRQKLYHSDRDRMAGYFLPLAYIPTRPVRDMRELLRYRQALVRLRTGLKNRVHALLDKLGILQGFTDLFGKAGRRFLAGVELRPVYRLELDNYLALIDEADGRGRWRRGSLGSGLYS